MRLASFNLQNLRLRQTPRGARLDGARDGDRARDLGEAALALDPEDRVLTAAVLKRLDADVVALQEVFDLDALEALNGHFLAGLGGQPYPFRYLYPGNDGRGLNVALMARKAPVSVTGHAALTAADIGLSPLPGEAADARIFRRDCLRADLGSLVLFVCHFKAPWPDADAARVVRRREAEAVRALIERRFADPSAALWMVLGDLNAPMRDDGSLAPLLGGFSVDLLERCPEGTRWTYASPDGRRRGRPDACLVSPALAARWPEAVPDIHREGMGRAAGPGLRPRLPGVGEHRPHASDHAAIVVDLPGL